MYVSKGTLYCKLNYYLYPHVSGYVVAVYCSTSEASKLNERSRYVHTVAGLA